MSSAVVLGAAFVGVLVVGLVVAIAGHRLPGADRVTAHGRAVARGSSTSARRLREGLAVAAGRGTLAAALVLSAVAWTASIATFLVGGQAVGVELTPLQGALLSSGVALATIVPSGPGYLGTFELTAVGDRHAVRDRPGLGVRDGAAGPRDDPARDLGRWRDRRRCGWASGLSTERASGRRRRWTSRGSAGLGGLLGAGSR